MTGFCEDDISMTKEDSMGLHINGIIPLKNKNNLAIAMETNFSNLSLDFMHRFIPKFFKINGKATGSISLNGTSEETYFYYDINIDNPEFDLVKMYTLVSKGNYNGKKLIVEMAQASNKDGFIKASGSVPFDLIWKLLNLEHLLCIQFLLQIDPDASMNPSLLDA